MLSGPSGFAPLAVALLAVAGLPDRALASSGLATCRTIADDQQRLACYDRLANQATSNATTPEALFGVEPTAATGLLQRQLGEEPVAAIEQRVATVERDHYGKLRVGLENGQRWGQIDSDKLRLKPGDTVTIRLAAMGSYLLHRTAGGRSIRVRRLDVVAHDGTAAPARPD